MTSPDLAQRRLSEFADEASGVSPLYEHLARHAADDPEVARLLTAAPEAHASGALLLAAAHRLVQVEPFHPLSNYYPSLGGTYGPDEATWPLFRDFLLERSERVRELVATRTTRTCEVRGAAVLFPAVAIAAKQAGAPVGLLEAGTSAGLLLGLDQYAYRYQTEQAGQVVAGPAKAAVGLHCALELAPGAELPKLPKSVKVAAKAGIGEPADLDDEDAYAWLEACVWADQPERLRLFGVAAGVLRKKPPQLLAGDPVADLPKAADLIPADAPLVVLTYASGLDLLPALAELPRPAWWVGHEGGELRLSRSRDGQTETRVLARTEAHGQRLVWLPTATR
ncbi:hypothetical protein Lesp02_80000 [Lentzea sp. NBRC 105346]|uniref:DUF2332 domain-containing protein n=1 Tax=Lentzea sp. NBRC 105346 TaxID=3032205 RepID=UPI0024A36A96|nr:DUF2332 domain-containing protein [Lentzea sp. NBRC 105346]GLZ35813.1 hypothetical protein Lesp02_80000 [Lentzea sp. NBRC 105346]